MIKSRIASRQANKTTPCPTCGKEVNAEKRPPYYPFCSERCKLIDLGAWLDESYTVPGEEPAGIPPDKEDEEH
jgi:endogenous inhibitor of DNA gyrase (YacG/DUF329 family)